MMSEFWKPIPSTNSLYQASSLGRIKGRFGRVLSPLFEAKRGGYKSIQVRGCAPPIRRRVARLVCEAFHGAPPDGFEADHIDGNRINDCPENLRWLSVEENRARRTPPAGERNGNAKITLEEAREVFGAVGRHADIAAKFGISRRTVGKIKEGKLWKILTNMD